ncbi:MAG: allophanate hydrolase [Gammaproteobacteria bacterium]|jgi:allophanate hydrolase
MDITIQGLLNAYRQRNVSPEQVVDYVLAQCKEHQDNNIWITRLNREQIQPYLDKLAGQSPDSLPLYGIPFAIKDNIDLQDVATTAACPAFTYTPKQSAYVIQQLISAGAIPIGKTNMDQFATGLVGTRSPEPWGPCKNAFNPEYISGGSSSGSAVAVALGLVSFSLGTDTAGSGRVPAAFNNIIGVKPSRGLLSNSGVVPACRSLDCVSIFALTTDDANSVLNIAASHDTNDDYARANAFDNNHRHYGRASPPLTIGVPRSEKLNFFGNASAQQLFFDSMNKCKDLGITIREIDFSPFLDAARLLYEGPWVAERYVAIENLITNHPEELLPEIRTIIGSGESKSAIDYFKSEYLLQHYRNIANNILSGIDCLVTPTAGTIYTIEQVQSDPIKLNSNLGYYTNFMNLLDCASVAVPAGFLDNGCPSGITFIGPAMSDRKLLSIANFWQQRMGLNLGAVDQPLPATQASQVVFNDVIPVVVCGAHLKGLPLNWQLTERGATLLEQTQTTATYRMYVLPGGPPQRPGLIRDDQYGDAIDVEVWEIPKAEFGSFVANIPAPLGIGKVELKDGRLLPGFICESYGVQEGQEITHLGSWKKYLNSQNI